jgi:hypothetical protein
MTNGEAQGEHMGQVFLKWDGNHKTSNTIRKTKRTQQWSSFAKDVCSQKPGCQPEWRCFRKDEVWRSRRSSLVFWPHTTGSGSGSGGRVKPLTAVQIEVQPLGVARRQRAPRRAEGRRQRAIRGEFTGATLPGWTSSPGRSAAVDGVADWPGLVRSSGPAVVVVVGAQSSGRQPGGRSRSVPS